MYRGGGIAPATVRDGRGVATIHLGVLAITGVTCGMRCGRVDSRGGRRNTRVLLLIVRPLGLNEGLPPDARANVYGGQDLARRPHDWRADYHSQGGLAATMPWVGKSRPKVEGPLLSAAVVAQRHRLCAAFRAALGVDALAITLEDRARGAGERAEQDVGDQMRKVE